MEISHGHRVTSRDDPFVRKANVFADNFAEASLPNNHIVDWLPFCKHPPACHALSIRFGSVQVWMLMRLRPMEVARFPSWLPGMGFKEKARRFREQYFSLAEEGHRMVKDDIVRPFKLPSLYRRTALTAFYRPMALRAHPSHTGPLSKENLVKFRTTSSHSLRPRCTPAALIRRVRLPL